MNEAYAKQIEKRLAEARQEFCRQFKEWRAAQNVSGNRIAEISRQVCGRRRVSAATILRLERGAENIIEAERLRFSSSLFFGLGAINTALIAAAEGKPLPLGVRSELVLGIAPFCAPNGEPYTMATALLAFHGCLETDPVELPVAPDHSHLACLLQPKALGRTVEEALRYHGASLLDLDDILTTIPADTTDLKAAIYGRKPLSPEQLMAELPDLAQAISVFLNQEISVDSLISICEELEDRLQPA